MKRIMSIRTKKKKMDERGRQTKQGLLKEEEKGMKAWRRMELKMEKNKKRKEH